MHNNSIQHNGYYPNLYYFDTKYIFCDIALCEIVHEIYKIDRDTKKTLIEITNREDWNLLS